MEICIDSIESARNAIKGGAMRLEVCSALSEGGLTPTPGMVKQIKSFSTVPIYTMIRIRPGDFVYSAEEITAMLHDLNLLKTHVDGFVFGALTLENEIDVEICTRIIEAARPLPVTFHRAFDELKHPMESLETLIELGFERILTSGQKNTAEEGLELIKVLIQQAAGKIIIMPGAGITKENIRRIKLETGVKEFHASAKKKKIIPNVKIKMGQVDTSYIMVTDTNLVQEMVSIVLS